MQATLGGASSRRPRLMKVVLRAFSRQLTIALPPPPPSKALLPASASSSSKCAFLLPTTSKRSASSASSSQWKSRQSRDQFARSAKVQGLKSRAAFKLLEMDQKYHIFKKNAVVVDLGYAPGSWSQVALERTKPRGLVVGIDLIPAQPPKGATSIQGDFLSPKVQKIVKDVLLEQWQRRKRETREAKALEREKKREKEATAAAAAAAGRLAEEEGRPREREEEEEEEEGEEEEGESGGVSAEEAPEKESNEGVVEGENGGTADKEEGGQVPVNDEKGEEAEIAGDRPSYIDMEKMASHDIEEAEAGEEDRKMVDVVLSDMSEPWPQTAGFKSKTLSKPYHRLMNTSGMPFRDHAGSMDLCYAALQFATDTLKKNGTFVCKFYQGSEDKMLEEMLKKVFKYVHRQKPESSRKDSKEAYFVALKKKHQS